MSVNGDSDLTRQAEPADSTERIGPYHLLQIIGEGGMGEVWVAEQREPIRRTVAIKIIKLGMDSRQVVARFNAERQALAVMDHPAIARVIDGGITEQGRPYFVMEYVKGEPITNYCDRQRLPTADRLKLFMRVCEGVQHAHQKGIIHRDLKPSNVLVTIQESQPVPKIIDFGIAKATAHKLTEQTVFTELGVLIGTPEYMSPEQAEMTGLDIDTRTDIYSLGVLLYELLTGTLPFDRYELRAKALDEIRRTIRETDPPRPSTRITQSGHASTEAAKNRLTEPGRLASQLRGDLDWITMRALEKDRTRRYESAMALAHDIERHLDDQPVVAGPPGASYRAKKFVRRHRFGVASAAALGVVLIVFGIAMAVQAERIARERDRANREAVRANQEAATAKQVSSFLVGLFEVSKPSEAAANSVTARQILDRGAEQVGRELGGQSTLQAALLTTIGDAYSSLGVYGEAERTLKEALRLRRRSGQSENADLGKTMVTMADVFAGQGRFVEAERLHREAVQLLRRVAPPDSTLAYGLVSLAYVLSRNSKSEEAVRTAREAVELYRRLPMPAAREVTGALSVYASILADNGDKAGAEQAYTEGLNLARHALGPRHPASMAIAFNLAGLRLNQGQYSHAEAVYREILAAERVQLGAEHPDLTGTLNNLGAALFLQGRYHDAEQSYREALAIRRKVLGDSHPGVAIVLRNVGEALDAQAQYVEADAAFREALTIDSKSLGPDHPSVALTLSFLSNTLRHMRRFSEAEAAAQEALAIDTARLGPDHRRTREAEKNLGMALAKQGRWTEAEPLLLRYVPVAEENGLFAHDFVDVANEIIEMYKALGKPEKAAEWRAKLAVQKKYKESATRFSER